MRPAPAFEPPWLLRNPHVQTVLGSHQHPWLRQRARELNAAGETRIVTTPEGVRLKLVTNLADSAPTAILIHGWLGHGDSSYMLSATAELWLRKFSVVRLNLRDHGDTAHFNEELFHSARIQEVVDAVLEIQRRLATGPCALLGYSLGGNFVLRVAKATGLPALAVCPAMDPCATMRAIDTGWIGYRLFFVRKWQSALKAKQAAFPGRYDFRRAMRLRSVAALTDMFVREHTPFSSTEDYLSRYTLTGGVLEGTRASIVYAEDDPVIPSAGFRHLPDTLNVMATTRGGHCAFVDRTAQPRWIDRFAAAQLAVELGLDRDSEPPCAAR